MNANGQCVDENINRILRYIYSNQDFSTIKSEINDMNMSAIYSQAYVMKCTNLLRDLSSMIVNELLTPANATLYYLDAVMVSQSYFLFTPRSSKTKQLPRLVGLSCSRT